MDDLGPTVAGHPALPAPSSRRSRRADDLIRLWSVTIPRRIESWAPRIADAFADGAWTAIWPRVTAYAPVLAFVIGLMVSVALPFLPADFSSVTNPRVWTELLAFMMLVTAVGVLHGTAGIGLLAGVVVGDVLRLLAAAALGGWGPWSYLSDNPLIAVLTVIGLSLISYLLLAIPAVTLPMVARALAERTPLRRISSLRARMIARAGVYLLAAGLLTFFWTRAVVVLIRPFYVWRTGSPTIGGIEAVQFGWEWIVGAAVLAVLGRVVLQELVVRRSSAAGRIAALQMQRWDGATPGAFWDRIGAVPRIGLIAATVTLLLAGTYEDPVDAVFVFAIAAMLSAWRMGLIRPTAGWAQTVERIPAIGRLVIAGVIGYALARVVVELLYSTNSLRIVLVGILLILGVFALLFPAQTIARPRGNRAGRIGPSSVSTTLMLPPLTAIGLSLLLPSPVFADNCSSLGDCWSTAAGAASAAAGAAFGAIGGLFGGMGGGTPPPPAPAPPPEGEYGEGPPVPEPPSVGSEGSGSDIEQKAGSDITNLSDNMRSTFDDIVRVWGDNSAGTPVITSGNDGTHGTNSLHYDDDAIDLRGKNYTDAEQDELADDLGDALGDDYDVISEHFPNNPNNDHIHVEYDP